MDSGFIYHIFLLTLPHRSATTALVWNDFNEKVLLKLSSLMKFSQNFSAVKVIAVAPHHGLYSHNWLLTYPLVWAIALSNSKGNARSPINRIKQ